MCINWYIWIWAENTFFFLFFYNIWCQMTNYEGVAVGCGWQAFVAYVNIGSYYIVGIPLGSLLGFYFKLGAKVRYLFLLVLSSSLLIGCKYGTTRKDSPNYYVVYEGNMVRDDRRDTNANHYIDMGHLPNRLEERGIP